MAADTFSPILGILKMGTGNDNNIWGDNWNNAVGAILEKAIAGQIARPVTGGTLDLSAGGLNPPNAASTVIEEQQIFTGALTGDQIVVVPNLPKRWLILNQTSGAFALLLKTPSGSTIAVPQGTEKIVFCDGANSLLRADRHDVGEVRDFAGSNPPPGTLECDGSAISRTRYPDLYAKIGTTWGGGDGFTTFNLPNLKDTGRYRRSRTNSLPPGSTQANQVVSHNHAASASSSSSSSSSASTSVTVNTSGALSMSGSGTTNTENQGFNHNYTKPVTGQKYLAGSGSVQDTICVSTATDVTGSENQNHNHNFGVAVSGADHVHSASATTSVSTTTSTTTNVTVNAAGGSETRPESAVFATCIRV